MRHLRAFTEHIMGMPISVHVRAHDADRLDIAHAAHQVLAHLRKVDKVFSLYRADSELMRWRRGELPMRQLHPWVDEVEGLCDRATTLTGGLLTSQLPAPQFGAAKQRHGTTRPCRRCSIRPDWSRGGR